MSQNRSVEQPARVQKELERMSLLFCCKFKRLNVLGLDKIILLNMIPRLGIN